MTNSIILEPQSVKKNHPIPLCMAFHGNDSNPQEHAEFWRPLSRLGWLVALPQSSRAGAQPHTFIWNTPGLAEWNFQEVQDCLTEIKQKYKIDVSRIILAGFSMGGGLAIEMVLGGYIAALGFVVVAPYVSYKYVDPQSAYGDFVKTQAKRGYCIVGEQDSFAVEGTAALALRLPNMGISCFVERHSNLAHDYPSDFEKSLSKAVEYVSSR
jgi:poly(3-hydroxybutyrate) depolymerase